MNTDDVKILIVDDESRNLDALEAMLASSGCALVRALSADDALLAMLRHDFAAMILDIRMPGMSGIELADLVKQRRRTQDVPILFLTAHLVEDSDVLRGYGVGAVDYLSKPIRPEILRSKVSVFVELHRKTRALAALNDALHQEVAERHSAQRALEQANEELERRVAERTKALTLARDEAERQSRLKDEFLATLSHELRTPMNAILGWLSMLTKGEAVSASETREAIAVIQRNAQIQAKLIDDLLEMNKLSHGDVRLELEPTDVGVVLDAAMQALRPAADSKGVGMAVVVDPSVPPITADARRVQQILWNILHNAVKFTPTSGCVDVDVSQDGRYVRVSVKDTGHGIVPEFLPYVFDRFRQADSSTTRGAWGLGIGLSIAKHLVELHGGSIQASSPGPGQGSTFVVEFPILSAADSSRNSERTADPSRPASAR
jgi:signal transduction histidine kinase